MATQAQLLQQIIADFKNEGWEQAKLDRLSAYLTTFSGNNANNLYSAIQPSLFGRTQVPFVSGAGAGTTTTTALTALRTLLFPMRVNVKPATNLQLRIHSSVDGGAGKLLKGCMWSLNNDGTPGAKIVTSNTADAHTTGIKTLTFTTTPDPGYYWFGVASDGTPTLVTWNGAFGAFGGSFGVETGTDFTNGDGLGAYIDIASLGDSDWPDPFSTVTPTVATAAHFVPIADLLSN